MSSPYTGEIRIFPFSYPPINWALCQGGTLPSAQYRLLSSVIGGTYPGGNGTTTFGLPDLSGRVPVGTGQGDGLSRYLLGQSGGASTVTLNMTSLAGHTHPLAGDQATANSASPITAYYARGAYSDGQVSTYATGTPDTTMRSDAIGYNGGGQPHNNLMPYLTLNFCICINGQLPPRS